MPGPGPTPRLRFAAVAVAGARRARKFAPFRYFRTFRPVRLDGYPALRHKARTRFLAVCLPRTRAAYGAQAIFRGYGLGAISHPPRRAQTPLDGLSGVVPTWLCGAFYFHGRACVLFLILPRELPAAPSTRAAGFFLSAGRMSGIVRRNRLTEAKIWL